MTTMLTTADPSVVIALFRQFHLSRERSMTVSELVQATASISLKTHGIMDSVMMQCNDHRRFGKMGYKIS